MCDKFGYVEVKGGVVITYTDDHNNPTVYKFDHSEIVNAVKLQELVKEKIKYERERPNAWDLTNDDMADYLEELIKESEKN